MGKFYGQHKVWLRFFGISLATILWSVQNGQHLILSCLGFDLEEVGHLKYGREIHFWDFEKREPIETMYLGEDGLLPLEVKFHHDPDSSHGFLRGCAQY